MNPKISIITPSFNSGKYIEKAIISVLAQNYPNFEHIIVDGGSTDETLDILKKYDHLRWISEPDKGQSDAMNKGFQISKGDIIVYLNADDYFAKNSFYEIANTFKLDDSIDFIVGNLEILYDNGMIVETGANFRPEICKMLRWWEADSYPYNPVSYFYKRCVQEKIHFDQGLHHTMDYKFLLDACRYNFKIKKINIVLGTFSLRQGCKTFGSDNWKKRIEKFNFAKEYWKFCPSKSFIIKHYYNIYLPHLSFRNLIYNKYSQYFYSLILESFLPFKLKIYNSRFSEQKVLDYIASNRIYNGNYIYSKSSSKPNLYSCIYAILTMSLFGKLNELPQKDKIECLNYILSFQREDGLFCDESLNNDIAEIEDWWGWRHLTSHVITAITALNGKLDKPFKCLEQFYTEGAISDWLEKQDWINRGDFVSNSIFNYGTLLQYARDFQKNNNAKSTLEELFSWLNKHQDPITGLWGSSFDNPHTLSTGVQTSYHIWMLYFYDKQPIQYIEHCIDSCLKIQNRFGGFGVSLNSSACEDIDSIDPLARFYYMTNYRNKDIKNSLIKAYSWILRNFNDDGGFVFKRETPFIYGHVNMSSKKNESSMFPTWFRCLSLAYVNKVINDPELNLTKWNFVHCPGYQFWNN